jgi:DNA polymerase III subunit alpha, Gram-positive type
MPQYTVIADTETTGVTASARVVEVAMALLCDGELVTQAQSLICPGVPIPHEATAVHGITNDMVRHKPTLEAFMARCAREGWPLRTATVWAHNASFDRRFLGAYLTGHWECSLKKARHAWPFLENHKLDTVARSVGYRLEGDHRAMADVMACVAVVKALGVFSKKEKAPQGCLF